MGFTELGFMQYVSFLPFIAVIVGFMFFIKWLFRDKEPIVDESLKAKSEAYAKWMKTKSDEDYQKYLELKEVREIEKRKKK